MGGQTPKHQGAWGLFTGCGDRGDCSPRWVNKVIEKALDDKFADGHGAPTRQVWSAVPTPLRAIPSALR
jgi:hypothetical protein